MRSFPAEAAGLRDIRSFVRRCAEEHGVPDAVVTDIVLAVCEAATNALRHSSTPVIEVRVDASESFVEVGVRDYGLFGERDGRSCRDEPGGRGLPLVHALMDDVTLSPGTPISPGTTVWMRKRITGTSASRAVGS